MFDSDDDDRFDAVDFSLDLDSNYYQPAPPSSQPADPAEPVPTTPPVEQESSQPPPSSSTIVSFPPASRSGPTFPTISGLFPRCSINLLGGSSFSGRTRFILPQFDHYVAGLPFLNRPVPDPPEQLGMIVCGRDGEDYKARIEQLDLRNLTNTTFPIARWSGRIRDESEYSPVFPLEKCYADLTAAAGREPRFLLIESIQKLAPINKISEYTPVCDFFDAMREWCKSHHCTVLGTVVKAKARQGAAYETIAEQIYGAVAWADNANCVIGIDRYSPTSTIRKIVVLSKASCGEIEPLWANFNDQGHLELVPRPESVQKVKQITLDQILRSKREAEYTRADILQWGEDKGISARTVAAWIGECIESGSLQRKSIAGKVVFIKPQPN